MFSNLVFGGYDASRFVPNNISFTFAPDISRDLVVGIQSIKSKNSSGAESTLMSDGILAFVDSTVPYIWLPENVCRNFEKAFGLSWNSKEKLYLVNDSLHESLLESNATVTFTLGNSLSGGETMDVLLPYASFDLIANYPLVVNTTRYFPLQRASSDAQYTLGRTFLQEA
jgi:Eukaryotic aspartyl protease